MNADMQLYYEYTVSPLGELFYATVAKQLEDINGKKILDFGSGFGFTADFLAQNNDVTAIEMDASMLAVSKNTQGYTQIHGGLEALKALPAASFDVVLCHLVFEFVEDAHSIWQELLRVVKEDGLISVIRHNRAGRIVQAVVQEYDVPEVYKLLQGGHAYSSAFGDIKYYENEELLTWAQQDVHIQAVYGVRALASLHGADMQRKEGWLENMLSIEWKLLQNPHFVPIAYFNHILLKKN